MPYFNNMNRRTYELPHTIITTVARPYSPPLSFSSLPTTQALAAAFSVNNVSPDQ